MTTKQKIWFSIFLAMFLVPEVLWNPVANFYYEFWQGMHASTVFPLRNNFLMNSDNLFLLKLVIWIQFFGLGFTLLELIAVKVRKIYKFSGIFLLLTLLVFVLFSALFHFGLG
jgi:hypothetical protein